MKISCDKAAEICTMSQYNEASWWQKLRLKIHVFYCKNCARYTSKNTKLTTLCEQGNIHVIPENEKEMMKEKLKKQL